MDTAQWPQEILVKPVEEIITNTTTTTTTNSSCTPKPSSATTTTTHAERKAARPAKEQPLNCPRCNSTNTKFCYYNNYSLTQPRYFCKTCRRYWTAGGSLRNIPVGGGSRKNRRSCSSSSSLPSNSNRPPDLIHQNPSKIHGGQDLNLSFPSTTQGISSFSELIQVPSTSMLNGMSSRGLMSSLISLPMHNQDPNTTYTSGFLQDFKITGSSASLNFSLDGLGVENDHGYGHDLNGVQEISTERQQLLFPFEDLKQPNNNPTPTTEENRDQHQQHGDNSSGGYWTGMLGGGSW